MNEFYQLFDRLKRAKLIPRNAKPSVYRLFYLLGEHER